MDIVSQIDHKVDRLAFEIRPAALTELGLEAAVRQLVEKFAGESGIDVDLHFDERMDRARLSDVVEGTLYRVLQEALTNVWRHAQATSVSIILDQRNHHAQMIIEDDGAGFDVEKVSTGRFGLLGIRERVALVGGTVNIESTLRGGTTLFVRVPIEKRGIQ
jgi:signal transduction histidine kinase